MRLVWRALSLALVCLSAASSGVKAAEMVDEISSISIIADADLALPMTDIVLAYTKEKHQAVSAAYPSAIQQETEVSEGASYDVLITARPRLIDSLKLKGLVDIYSEATIARNQLVLIAAQTNPFNASLQGEFPLAEMINYFNGQSGLLLGNPETLPSGSVAREALRNYSALEYLEQYTLFEKDVSEIMRMVREEGKLALVYQSDAQATDIRMVDRVSPDTYSPIVYVAVVLAGDKMDEARQFVDYLKQVQTQRVFERYGFVEP
jgi:molybdate transport system substrate-binding protein